VAGFSADTFGAPDWVLKIFVVFLALGLPLALFLAWAFEMTPDGIKREKDVDRSQSITHQTGRRLNNIIVGVLVLAVGLLLTDRFTNVPGPAPAPVAIGDEAELEIVATESQSIAVLPFANMSDDSDHFADGLSEELLNLLAKMPDLKVAGRTSSFEFKGRNDDLREIGDALGVNHVLEGSVRRSGDRLRITAQLIKVDDGFHVWSETYDRTMADIFDIQDDVAGEITRALKLQFAPTVSNLTGNTEAYALYLQAIPYVASNADPDMLNIVIGLLDQAIALDPEFAKAHELKALAYWATTGERIDSPTARPLIAESARNALALDSSLILARLLDAIAGSENWAWESELQAAEEAFDAAPGEFNIARILCADYMFVGYFQRSLDCSRKMFELEPLSATTHYRLGAAYSALGRREEARASWRRVVDLGGEYQLWEIAVDHLIAGEYDEAYKALDEMRDPFYWWSAEDARRVVEGHSTAIDANAFLDAWVSDGLAGASDFLDINSVYYWYLAMGYLDEYWQAIHKVAGDSPYDWSNAEYLILNGNGYRASNFRRHPRYIESAYKAGLTDLWDKRGAPDFCSKIDDVWVCE
jgi:TolB-like protein